MMWWKRTLFAIVLFVVLMAGISQLEVYYTEKARAIAELSAGQKDAVSQEAMEQVEKSWGIRIKGLR